MSYNTVSPEALNKWNNLKNSLAPSRITDDVAKNTDLFIENENWIIKTVNGGYEIRNLGNPSNDSFSSVFFDMEVKSVPW